MSEEPIDLLAPAVVRDPYPLYAALRRERPLAALKQGGYLLTRHADVKAALADPALVNAPSRFSVLHASKADRHEAARMAGALLPFQDPPVHTANRRRVLEAFSPAAKDTLQRLPDLAAAALARLDRARPFDLIDDFGAPYSSAVMAAFLSLEADEAAEQAAGADAFFRLFAPIPDAETLAALNEGLAALRARMRAAVARQLAARGPSFARALAEAGAGADEPDVETVADTCILLFADGIENVRFAIALGWAALGDVPEGRARLLGGDGTAEALVGEVLRLHAPAQSIPRIAGEDLTLHGTRVRRGMPVHLSLASANRDETVFAHPDRPVLAPGHGRENALSFGAGRHACIGGRLASAMVAAALVALAHAGVAPSAGIETLSFRPRFAHRWPERAPAAFERA